VAGIRCASNSANLSFLPSSSGLSGKPGDTWGKGKGAKNTKNETKIREKSKSKFSGRGPFNQQLYTGK